MNTRTPLERSRRDLIPRAPDSSPDSLLVNHRWLIRARWILITPSVLLPVGGLFFADSWDSTLLTMMFIPFVVVACHNAVFTWIAWRLHPRNLAVLQLLGIAQILADSLIITYAVAVSGGVEGGAFFLYFLPLVSTGILLPPHTVYLSAAVSGLLYDLLLLLQYSGQVPRPFDPGFMLSPDAHTRLGTVTSSIIMVTGGLFICALLVYYLARITAATQARLQELAATDGLTGLYNYRVFYERLGAEIEQAQRHQRPLALIMVDLDHFKQFNDRHGHPAGDQALRQIAGLLRGTVRAGDIVARYGGEEFAVITPEASPADAERLAQRLLVAIRAARIGGQGDPAPLSASLGVAVYPAHGTTASTLVTAADSALYAAKSAGRNRVYSADTRPLAVTSGARG